jgi:hypothetical protein
MPAIVETIAPSILFPSHYAAPFGPASLTPPRRRRRVMLAIVETIAPALDFV